MELRVIMLPPPPYAIILVLSRNRTPYQKYLNRVSTSSPTYRTEYQNKGKSEFL